MKINVELECTPEEARRTMGLPDFTPIHEKYMASLMETMDKGVNPELFEAMLRSWAPMGEAGIGMWRRLFETAGKAG